MSEISCLLFLTFWLYEFAFKYNYNCKYCSTKSSLQNLHENDVASLWINLLLNINIIVSIVEQNLPSKHLHTNGVIFLRMNVDMNIIVSIVQRTFWQKAPLLNNTYIYSEFIRIKTYSRVNFARKILLINIYIYIHIYFFKANSYK